MFMFSGDTYIKEITCRIYVIHVWDRMRLEHSTLIQSELVNG